MHQLRAMRIGWVLLILSAGLAVLDVPYAAPVLIGTAILTFVLTIRFIAARSESRLQSAYGNATTSSDTTQGSWLTDAIGWTALSAVHHHHDANADDDRKPQADASESAGGFFSFFSDSGSSDSGGSGSDAGSSDYSSSDAGSSDSGSSSGGSWD